MTKTIILHIPSEDTSYLPYLKPILSGKAQVLIDSTTPTTAYEFAIKAKQKQAVGVVTSDIALLRLLLPDVKKLSISSFAGSIIKKYDVEFLIIDPLDNLVTVNYGKFVTGRFLSKFLAPENWIKLPLFKWELYDPSKSIELINYFQSCSLIAVDIETVRDDPDRSMECISFTGGFFHDKQLVLRTIVVPCDSEFNICFIRVICELGNPKVFQNGKYDIAYLLRYRCPVSNYLLDTINLFHCWLSELPKDLGFISAMMVREYSYHKYEGSDNGKYARYSYNGKDTFYTFFAVLALVIELPDYGWENYFKEFPVVFPCILCEHTGMRHDSGRAEILKQQVQKQQDQALQKLKVMVANEHFNPGSWQQTLKLFHILGSKDIKSSDVKNRDKVAFRHPLNKRILDSITLYRENAKVANSYFKDEVSWKGRVFYTLNPHGTDTGRLASRESQFWCGLQIQNIPRDDEDGVSVKDIFIADPGFFIGEADYSQNEARGTAYLSGDLELIKAVEDTTKDFHKQNASKFFGVPYDEITKPLRDLSKRTNHGANYNMGPQVMLDTMGIEKVLQAKQLLKLPASWSLLKVTTHLLEVFSKTYPTLKGPWYERCKTDVKNTGFLVGPTGWSRKCFGKPFDNKRDLNSYVAHPPQSLAAMLLNKAFIRVFQEVWLPNQNNFKLLAQIHDSIIFQYRENHEHLAWKVKKAMTNETEIVDTFSVKRTMIVPVDLKGNGRRWSEITTLKQH